MYWRGVYRTKIRTVGEDLWARASQDGGEKNFTTSSRRNWKSLPEAGHPQKIEKTKTSSTGLGVQLSNTRVGNKNQFVALEGPTIFPHSLSVNLRSQRRNLSQGVRPFESPTHRLTDILGKTSLQKRLNQEGRLLLERGSHLQKFLVLEGKSPWAGYEERELHLCLR